MNLYFAPLEGIGGYIYRNAQADYFEKADKYFSPFLAPNQNRSISPKEYKDIAPEHNEGITLVPQIMANNAEIFLKAAQELEQLDADKTVFENVETDGYNEWQLHGILSNFLFYEDDINKNAAVLSPGEKARVALCKLLLQRANLLVLDEPTNHLDPETQAVIGGNFRQFEGTILVVSHNPSFVEQIGISRMLVLPSGEIRDYSRELLEYYYELNTADEE